MDHSVRETEQAVRDQATPAAHGAPSRPGRQRLDPNLRELQEQVQQALATRVRLKPSAAGGGKIEIRYSSDDELERLVEQLVAPS
jgi:ParB-like chromosome segregation protein Spo0J